MKDLARELVNRMPLLTTARSAELSIANARLNQPLIKQSIMDLPLPAQPPSSAIVVAAGPSLHRRNSVDAIVKSGYTGTVICADGALSHCLRAGLIPEYVVTLDPHPTRIARWFGDPSLTSVDDDYFRHQDLDPYFAVDELARNTKLIRLVNSHGPKIKAAICTSVAQSVAQRCADSGMPLYWWNPIFDDFETAGSMTEQIFNMNNVPCMVSGGNVGSAAWIFAHAILGVKVVALVGMDFGYAPGTPLENTQYYADIVNALGDNALEAYIDVYNEHLDETWFTDPAYYWYREVFLEMAQEADCKTFNCTEGGTLFGDGIEYESIKDFLSSYSPNVNTRG